jgi:hypothetical protein
MAACVLSGLTLVLVMTPSGTLLSNGAFRVAAGVCIPPPSGMTDWWPGDGNANDQLGRHNGIMQGRLTFTPGEVAQAFTFNGSDAAVTFGQAGNFATSDFTLDFWVSTASVDQEAVLEKRPTCSHGHFYGIRTASDITHPGHAGHLVVETDDDQGNYVDLVTNRAINDGAFHLTAFVRQGTTASVYIDGTIDSTATTPAVADVLNSAPLTAGKSVCDGRDGTVPLEGQIDEIELFSRALSASEILAIYEAGSAGKCKNPRLSPASVAFPLLRTVGTTSLPHTVKLTNVGSGDLDITGITLTGPEPGDFAQSNNCSSTVTVGASCLITVTFTPTAQGVRTASVSITDNAPGSPQTVPLTGRGSFFEWSPRSLNLGDQKIGTSSAARTVTLNNPGPAPITLFSIGITGVNAGDFTQTHTCGSSLNPGASCTIEVTFTPTAVGGRIGHVAIRDSAFGGTHWVGLIGKGT